MSSASARPATGAGSAATPAPISAPTSSGCSARPCSRPGRPARRRRDGAHLWQLRNLALANDDETIAATSAAHRDGARLVPGVCGPTGPRHRRTGRAGPGVPLRPPARRRRERRDALVRLTETWADRPTAANRPAHRRPGGPQAPLLPRAQNVWLSARPCPGRRPYAARSTSPSRPASPGGGGAAPVGGLASTAMSIPRSATTVVVRAAGSSGWCGCRPMTRTSTTCRAVPRGTKIPRRTAQRRRLCRAVARVATPQAAMRCRRSTPHRGRVAPPTLASGQGGVAAQGRPHRPVGWPRVTRAGCIAFRHWHPGPVIGRAGIRRTTPSSSRASFPMSRPSWWRRRAAGGPAALLLLEEEERSAPTASSSTPGSAPSPRSRSTRQPTPPLATTRRLACSGLGQAGRRGGRSREAGGGRGGHDVVGDGAVEHRLMAHVLAEAAGPTPPWGPPGGRQVVVDPGDAGPIRWATRSARWTSRVQTDDARP